MRKISLTNGELAVEILPDCGGAISGFRWMDSHRRYFDLLRAARESEIAIRLAGAMSCLPVTPFATPGNLTAHRQAAGPIPANLVEWTVQDASNVRATLTLHREAGASDSLFPSCQLLQRFELGIDGLRIQFTITNVGVRPMLARAGLCLRPDIRGAGVLRSTVPHIERADPAEDKPPTKAATLISPAGLAAGYRLARQKLHVMLEHARREFRFEWPEDNLALAVTPLQGFDYMGLDYNVDEQAIWLTLLSHRAAGRDGITGSHQLMQGDSLSASLLLSAVPLDV